ncbi:MAG: hypothetical protein MRY32_05000 [Rickettsiales bacterium]|nr:hypothetical protein [Rickettsiales bacterium]
MPELQDSDDKHDKAATNVAANQPVDKKEENASPPTHHSAFATNVGTWIHNHKTITDKNPIGYLGYQYIRSCFAAAPYGVSMAGTWLGFQKLQEYGAKMDMNPKLSESQRAFGRRMAQVTAYKPIRAAAMIGTSFSLYRGTSKLGKWVNESLFNPNDDKEKTISEVEHLPENLWHKVKEVAPAEFNATPVSAIVLGFITSAFDPSWIHPEHIGDQKGMMDAIKQGKGWKYFETVALHPKSAFIEHCAINTLGYSLFFELGDRRFKDKQISRGLWGGDAHSIGSGSKSSPSLLEQADEPEPVVQAKGSKYQRSPTADDKLSLLTSEPSVPRFFFRRVVPTAVGISLYTAFKFRGAPMILGPMVEGLKSVKDIPRAAWREGAATSLFFFIPAVTDKYVKWYDNFVTDLEEKVSGRRHDKPKDQPKNIGEVKPVKLDAEHAEKVERNHEALLDRLNEKSQTPEASLS